MRNRLKKIALILVFASIFHCNSAFAGINIQKIIKIESAGNPKAHNKYSGARGLMQITKICLQDYNQFHQVKFSFDDMFNPEKNVIVGTWYLNVRIPQLLKHYNISVTTKNIIVAYNAGINFARKGSLPKETRNYIKKYEDI